MLTLSLDSPWISSQKSIKKNANGMSRVEALFYYLQRRTQKLSTGHELLKRKSKTQGSPLIGISGSKKTSKTKKVTREWKEWTLQWCKEWEAWEACPEWEEWAVECQECHQTCRWWTWEEVQVAWTWLRCKKWWRTWVVVQAVPVICLTTRTTKTKKKQLATPWSLRMMDSEI